MKSQNDSWKIYESKIVHITHPSCMRVMSYNNQPGLGHVMPLSIFPLFLIARILRTCELNPHQNYLVLGNVQFLKGGKMLLETKEGRNVGLTNRAHVHNRIEGEDREGKA